MSLSVLLDFYLGNIQRKFYLIFILGIFNASSTWYLSWENLKDNILSSASISIPSTWYLSGEYSTQVLPNIHLENIPRQFYLILILGIFNASFIWYLSWEYLKGNILSSAGIHNPSTWYLSWDYSTPALLYIYLGNFQRQFYLIFILVIFDR